MKKSSKGWSKKKFVGEWAKTLQNYIAKNQEKVPAGFVRADDALKKWASPATRQGREINCSIKWQGRVGLKKRSLKSSMVRGGDSSESPIIASLARRNSLITKGIE